VRAFSRVLSGRFPEERVLSHDLIEGAHVRVGLASDIELFDEFPQGYQSYSRAHRWIRGDWQIAAWIFPRVPLRHRWLRTESALPAQPLEDSRQPAPQPTARHQPGSVAGRWLMSPRLGGIGHQLWWACSSFFIPGATLHHGHNPQGIEIFFLSKMMHDLLRATTDAALLPHQAAVSLDAIARVCYRR
jgi:cyclic beta-1,2-glucan synthetase